MSLVNLKDARNTRKQQRVFIDLDQDNDYDCLDRFSQTMTSKSKSGLAQPKLGLMQSKYLRSGVKNYKPLHAKFN